MLSRLTRACYFQPVACPDPWGHFVFSHRSGFFAPVRKNQLEDEAINYLSSQEGNLWAPEAVCFFAPFCFSHWCEKSGSNLENYKGNRKEILPNFENPSKFPKITKEMQRKSFHIWQISPNLEDSQRKIQRKKKTERKKT